MSVSCSGAGLCSELEGGGIHCECDPGLGGTDCSLVIVSLCHPDNCHNGGLCEDQDSGFTLCTCTPKWTGQTCLEGKMIILIKFAVYK